MIRKLMRGIVLVAGLAILACTGKTAYGAMRQEVISSTKTLPEKGEFNIIAEPFDWGKDVTRIMIHATGDVEAADLSVSDFSVKAKHHSEQSGEDDYNGPRKIKDVYTVDEEGNKTESGEYIILDLEYGSGVQGAHTGSYSYANYYTPLTLTYTVSWNGKEYKQHEVVNLLCDEFVLDRYKDPTIADKNYNFCDYAFYAPEESASKKPLIIFFHGMGEGGGGSLKNQGVQMYAYPEANFAGEEIQRIMGGGAYVLLPQSPSTWPNNGFTNESGYLEVVNNLIDSIIEENPGIDTGRIYVGGLSMGGYMASRVILSRPDKYAAAFLCAQAYAMTDADAQKLKDLPIWVSCSEADSICAMNPYTFASYQKLVKAGNVDAKCAVMESNQSDPTSRYRFYDNSESDYILYYATQEHENKVKGQFVWDNVSYSGHNGGWVPVFANGQYYVTDDDYTVTIMDWLASKNLYDGIEVDDTRAKKVFTQGEPFSIEGLVVNLCLTNNEKLQILDYSLSNVDPSKVGKTTVTVLYKGMTTSYDVTIVPKAIEPTPAVTPQVTPGLQPTPTQQPVLQTAEKKAKISLSSSKITLFKKGMNQARLKAVVTGSDEQAAWSSSNPKVAVVNGRGVVVAKEAGMTNIIARVSGAEVVCRVTVKNGTFKLKKTAYKIKKGKKAKIAVSVSSKKSVKFKSSSKAVKVDKNGLMKGVKKGKAVITVTFMGVSCKVSVTVK